MSQASPESASLPPAVAAQNKKNICDRISKAKRVKFYRNGDIYHTGVTIPVARERYRSFDNICDELTGVLKKTVQIPGAVRNIYTMNGKRIVNVEDLEDGGSYICSCNSERFKKGNYNTTPKSRPASLPVEKRKDNVNNDQAAEGVINGNKPEAIREKLACVQPRIVLLIRNGARPRSIMRLLLNKRNSPSFEQVLVTITKVVHLDTGCVRKVFTLSGQAVKELADFFGVDDIFLVYGKERVNYNTDFIFDEEEEKVMDKLYIPKRKKTIPEARLPPAILERYLPGNKLGEGAYGLVVKIQERDTGVSYALKIIEKSKYKGKKHFLDAERCILRKLQHPHIVSLISDLDYRGKRYYVLDYVGGGDLADVIFRGETLSEEEARVIIKRLASAMAYLHSLKIIHRDIKPANLLVELDSKSNIINVKLCDFGVACEATEPVFTFCGTPAYIAPEIIHGKGYGFKVDVWAAGCVLYALLVGSEPFVAYGSDLENMFGAIKAGKYVYPVDVDVSRGARNLIRKMLECEPEHRITSNEVLTHYWIRGYSNNCNDSI